MAWGIPMTILSLGPNQGQLAWHKKKNRPPMAPQESPLGANPEPGNPGSEGKVGAWVLARSAAGQWVSFIISSVGRVAPTCKTRSQLSFGNQRSLYISSGEKADHCAPPLGRPAVRNPKLSTLRVQKDSRTCSR
jgi:hypothetical protein